MKITVIAAAIALGGLAPALATPAAAQQHVESHHVEAHRVEAHRTVTHTGPARVRPARQVCHTEYRHHHRVRICRTVHRR